LNLGELPLQLRGDELRERPTLLVDVDVDATIGGDGGVGAEIVVLV
jgi:hypothetical protein